MQHNLIVRELGRQEYAPTVELMQTFTAQRNETTADEIWLLEHPPVYTLGTNATEDHVLDAGSTPVVRTDRGGQVTWHGPGQLMGYLLIDLKRNNLSVKQLVHGIEAAIIEMLAGHQIKARCESGAPGVYVGEQKIASLGIRVKRGCSYHGLAINVNNSQTDFDGINPCGYPGLTTTRVSDHDPDVSLQSLGAELIPFLMQHLKLEGAAVTTLQQGWRPA